MSRVVRVTVALSALLGLTALVYWPGLNGPLILDDIANLDILRSLSEQDRLSLANVLAERGGVLGGRPVSWAVFLINWHLSGADVWSFKLVNLMIHLLNGVLVFFLTRSLFSTVTDSQPASRNWLALAVCGFWLLTPLQVSSVLYVVQRMTLLSAAFSLAGLVAYCAGRQRLGSRPRLALVLMAVAIFLCLPLATLSKQNGALLLPLLLVVELLYSSRSDTPRWPLRTLLVLSGVLLMAGVLRVLVDPQWVLDTYPLRDFTLEQRLLTQPRVLLDYLLNVLQLPGGLALALFHDDFPVSSGLLEPPGTLIALLAWLAVLVFAWLLRGRQAGLALAGLVFFLVAHSLEAGPFALEMYFEHRNYLPSFGIWLAVMTLVAIALQRRPAPRLAAVTLSLLLAGHAALTAARVDVWRSFDGIVVANASTHPNSKRARAGAAVVAFTGGRLDEGLAHLDVVASVSGPSARLPVILKSFVGYCLANRAPGIELTGRFHSTEVLAVDPYTIAALRWYRVVTAERDCPGLDTVDVSRKLLTLAGRAGSARDFGFHWSVYDELSQILESAGQFEEARRMLRLSLTGAPHSRHSGMAERLLSLERR